MLRDRQLNFMNAVLGQDAAALNIREGQLSSATRIGIYRRNILATLSGALGDIFPTAKAMMGEAYFGEAAKQFIQQTRSTSGDLNQFGREWPTFLRDHSAPADVVKDVIEDVVDIARLDWAWHEAFHEAESDSLDLMRLGAVPAEQHADLIFKPHPSVRMMASAHPLIQIWQMHQPEYNAAEYGTDETDAQTNTRANTRANTQASTPANKNAPHPKPKRNFLIIHRGDADVTITTLAEAEYYFLACCTQQKTLAEAAEAAFQIDAEFNLQGFLMHAVQQNIIVDFYHRA